MAHVSRIDLERAARRRFAELVMSDDQPRQLHPIFASEELAANVEFSRHRIAELDDQLRRNQYDRQIETAAEGIALSIGTDRAALTPNEWLIAQQLSARAERERQARFVHQLNTPAQRYEPADRLFADSEVPEPKRATVQVDLGTGMTFKRAGELYLARKIAEGVGASQRTELKRVIDWLAEQVGDTRRLDEISKAELRGFRDGLTRIDVRLRGRKLAFSDRFTGDADYQIKSATALRYWHSIQGFFAWVEDESHIDANPAAGLKLAVKKGQFKKSPPPFSKTELEQFCRSPLYKGYQSPSRPMIVGTCHVRGGKWWMGILMMMTGMRAAEVSQLLPSDFAFDCEHPHLKISRTDEGGNQIKSVKSNSSIRDVPIAPVLLILGLRQFVERRAKLKPKERVFREFRLGTNGRKSDGATKFWGRYLKGVGLWKEGRATHVWRHTLIATLRANGVAEEDIQAVVGHARQTVTAGYGGAYPLSRKADTISKLDFGFDLIAALGGGFDAKRHA